MTSLNALPRTQPGAPAPKGGVRRTGRSPSRGAWRGDGRAKRLGQRVLGVAVALVIWQLYANGPGEAVGLPTPGEVARRTAELAQSGEYWASIGRTLFLAAAGLILAIAVGVPLGLFNGSSQRVTMSSQFIIDFARTVPPIAVVPLLLLVWGGTTKMALILILFGAVWPLLVQSTYAMQQVSPQLKQVAAAFQLSRADRITKIYIPSATPFLMTGFRIACTLSLLLAIVAGFFGGVDSIGKDLYVSLEITDSTTMFVYSATAALLGVLLNAVLLVLQKKVLWWHPSVRGGQS